MRALRSVVVDGGSQSFVSRRCRQDGAARPSVVGELSLWHVRGDFGSWDVSLRSGLLPV